MTSESASKPSQPLFLHVQFEIPQSATSSQVEVSSDNTATEDAGAANSDSVESLSKVDQCFDSINCNVAVVGLPEGVNPSKPGPGDFSYSGMHDHGPLPAPKEGGGFAQIIGFVDAAKKASDKYLTEVIEREKLVDSQQNKDKDPTASRKRKCDTKSIDE